jgi:hypothetical protein
LGRHAVSQAVYLDRILRGDWEERIREFAASGVRFFHLISPHGGADFFDSAFWTDDGVYPVEDQVRFPYPLIRQAEFILSIQPDAHFLIDFGTSVPVAWSRKYPGEMQTDETGQTYREASFASERYLRDLAVYVRHFVKYCEGRVWGNRIIGYKILPYCEGLLPLTLAGKMFDCSEANTRAFVAWVSKRYRTVMRLRHAWRDHSITFEKVRIPRDHEWLARREKEAPLVRGQPIAADVLAMNGIRRHEGFFHWIEPAMAIREQDYCRFMRHNFLCWALTITRTIKSTVAAIGRTRIVGIDATKQPMMGWEITSAFDGVGEGHDFPNMLMLSGSWGVSDLLDDKSLDFIWTPADYTARHVGCAYEAEGVVDSLVLRGKAMILENDSRCHVGAGVQEQGAFRDDAEVEAGLMRNAALTLSRGFQSYWCNVGSSYFHNTRIHRTIARVAAMLDRLNTMPHCETRDAVALILDDTSGLYEDFTSGYQYLSVVWQRVLGLAHCGVPYRIYLLDDLKKTSFPDYKVYLFPNLFRVDRRIMSLLYQKVLRNGNVAIFGPSTGITNGRYLGVQGAEELMGVSMELAFRTTQRHVLVQDRGHPISRELPANLIYGDSLTYGPLLLPKFDAFENDGAIPLGMAISCWFFNRVGLFIKEYGRGAAGNGRRGPRGSGDYAVVWSAAVPLPSSLLRAAARYAGCHVWCEEDDVIYASESIAAIHTTKAGERVLRLPTRRTVYDAVTNRLVGNNILEIKLHLKSPDTRIFTLE